jgi:hypothetical protein
VPACRIIEYQSWKLNEFEFKLLCCKVIVAIRAAMERANLMLRSQPGLPFGLIDSVTNWLSEHKWITGAGVALSAVLLLASLVLIPWVVVRIPADYLAHNRPPQMPWAKAHPALRTVLVVVKNALGAFLAILGILLLVLPGPGILITLAGLALVDIPGRRKLIRWIATRKGVFDSINKLRAQYGKPPLEKPEESTSETADER